MLRAVLLAATVAKEYQLDKAGDGATCQQVKFMKQECDHAIGYDDTWDGPVMVFLDGCDAIPEHLFVACPICGEALDPEKIVEMIRGSRSFQEEESRRRIVAGEEDEQRISRILEHERNYADLEAKQAAELARIGSNTTGLAEAINAIEE